MTQILNINGQSNIKVKMTESGAKAPAWQQFGRDCVKDGIKTIQDVMNDTTSEQRISYTVDEMPLMRVPKEMIEAIRKGETFDWQPSIMDIVSSHKATVRTEDGEHSSTLGIVGSTYGTIQNQKAFEFIDFIKEASGTEPIIESYGSLGNGERMFVCCRIGEDMYLNPNDAIRNYVVFTNSHNGSTGCMMFATPTRVICSNTLNFAIKESQYKINYKHTSRVNERLDWTIERNRKIAAEVFENVGLFKEDFINRLMLLKGEKVDSNFVRDFVGHMTLSDTNFALWKKADFNADRVEEISTKSKNIMAALTDSIENGIGQEYNRGTKVWLLNGVTTYLQNGRTWKDEGEDKFNSLMFGDGQKKVDKAYKLLMAA